MPKGKSKSKEKKSEFAKAYEEIEKKYGPLYPSPESDSMLLPRSSRALLRFVSEPPLETDKKDGKKYK